MKTDKRRIYGVEGAVDYFFADSDWSVGSNFNLQKSETKVDGSWEKWSVDFASPSKVNTYIGWEPNDWALRLQSQQTFNLTDAAGKKLDGYNTVDLLGSYMLPVGKVSFAVETCWIKITPQFGDSGHKAYIALNMALQTCTIIKAVAELCP